MSSIVSSIRLKKNKTQQGTEITVHLVLKTYRVKLWQCT